MELEEVVDKLKELGGLPSYSSSDKSEIERLYKEVLGKEFTKTSCNDCYRDAVIEMTVYIMRFIADKRDSQRAVSRNA